jgi:hypothetical protein
MQRGRLIMAMATSIPYWWKSAIDRIPDNGEPRLKRMAPRWEVIRNNIVFVGRARDIGVGE